jgi:uncharacterized protein (TIGR02271 family)
MADDRAVSDAAGGSGAADASSADRLTTAIPVVEEHLRVETRRVDTHAVRLRKHVEANEVELDVPLEREQVEIERVAIGRVVEATEPPRREGDLTVVPVYEEVLVKRWLLREELRIRHVRTVEPGETIRTVLRREDVEVVRTPIAAGASLSTPSDPEQRP